MKFNISLENQEKSGVYIIRSTITNDTYIGSAVNFKKRHYQHLADIKRRHIKGITEYCDKHGAHTLYMEVLLICSSQEHHAKELHLIHKLQPTLNKQSLLNNLLPYSERYKNADKKRETKRNSGRSGKHVMQISLTGEVIAIHTTIKQAAKTLKLSYYKLQEAVRRNTVLANFKWELTKDNQESLNL